MNLKKLNQQYAIKDQLEFVTGKGGFTLAEIKNKFATARISLYAGQLLSYCPTGASQDLLFNSELAYYETGKAIKGGVPVCWPWFGSDPEDRGRPAHGFARTSQWNVVNTHATEDATCLTLQLTPSEQSQKLWEHDFLLTLEMIVGKTLQLKLTTTNKSQQAVSITQALHTYFKVGDISRTTVEGLEEKAYLDKVDQGIEKRQQGSVTISAEVDRIYTDVSNDLLIKDRSLSRDIRIHSSGSHSTVVWNPWTDIAAEMADLEDADYQRLICVETANSAPDVIDILPGQSHQLAVEYQIN